jgi:hypothetical protein
LKGFEDWKVRQVIRTVKYADEFVLLAKKGTVIRDMIDRRAEIGKFYGMEMNVEKSNVMRIPGGLISPIADNDRSEKTRECRIFQLFW